MVIVVMCDKQKIYFGQIIGSINIRTRKRSGSIRNWRCIAAEYRIHQKPFAIQLDKIRGMAKPHQYVFMFRQGLQISSDSGYFINRGGSWKCPENKVECDFGHGIPFGNKWGEIDILKTPVLKIG